MNEIEALLNALRVVWGWENLKKMERSFSEDCSRDQNMEKRTATGRPSLEEIEKKVRATGRPSLAEIKEKWDSILYEIEIDDEKRIRGPQEGIRGGEEICTSPMLDKSDNSDEFTSCQESKKLKSVKEEKGLDSETEMELCEADVEYEDYPPSDYEEELKDDEGSNQDRFNDLPEDLQKIILLPYDQVPEKKRGWRRTYRPLRTRDEEAFYRHVIRKTDGFEVPSFFDRSPNFGEHSPYRYETVHGSMLEKLEGYCKHAISKYNDEKGTNYMLKYLIRMCGNGWEHNITFALTDLNYDPYVGRVMVDIPYGRQSEPTICDMRVTKGAYRVPNFKDAKNAEYRCEVNEVYKEKLPQLEETWKKKMNLK